MIVLLALLVLSACPVGAGDGVCVELDPAAPGVWLHTSYHDLPGAPHIPSNGLVVETEAGLVLVDTAWGEVETEVLLAEIATRIGRPVIAALVTHAHEDRLGGTEVLIRRGIPVYGSDEILAMARQRGLPLPDHRLEDLPAWLDELAWYHPGGGHTAENIVVYHGASALLFGGCLVRPAGASTLGNTADADLEHWSASVAAVAARFPDMAIVIPGHGPAGGPDLLDATIRLAAPDDTR